MSKCTALEPPPTRFYAPLGMFAPEDKNYQLALRASDNVIELFPKYGTGYLYKAITLYKLGKPEPARLVFNAVRNLYSYQLKSENITTQDQKEALLGLETAELHLKLLKTTTKSKG